MRFTALILTILLFTATLSAQQTWVGSYSTAGRLPTGYTDVNCTVQDSYNVLAFDIGNQWLIGPDCVPVGSPALLVAGFGSLFAPFKGGVMVPTLDIVLPFTTFGATLVVQEPAPVPPGLSLLIQFWVADPLGPVGVGATGTLTWMST